MSLSTLKDTFAPKLSPKRSTSENAPANFEPLAAVLLTRVRW
jgi:hypothetical protein